MTRNLIIPIFFHCWCYWSSSFSIPSSFIIFFKSSWVVWVFKAQAYELSRPGVTIKPVQDKDTPLPYIYMCVDPRQFPQARVFSRFVLVFSFVLFWFCHEPGSNTYPMLPHRDLQCSVAGQPLRLSLILSQFLLVIYLS